MNRCHPEPVEGCYEWINSHFDKHSVTKFLKNYGRIK